MRCLTLADVSFLAPKVLFGEEVAVIVDTQAQSGAFTDELNVPTGKLLLWVGAQRTTSSSVVPLPTPTMTGYADILPNPTQAGGGFSDFVRYAAGWGHTQSSPWPLSGSQGVAIGELHRTTVAQSAYLGSQNATSNTTLPGAKTPGSAVYMFVIIGRTTSSDSRDTTDMIAAPPSGWDFIVWKNSNIAGGGPHYRDSILVFRSSTESSFPIASVYSATYRHGTAMFECV